MSKYERSADKCDVSSIAFVNTTFEWFSLLNPTKPTFCAFRAKIRIPNLMTNFLGEGALYNRSGQANSLRQAKFPRPLNITGPILCFILTIVYAVQAFLML